LFVVQYKNSQMPDQNCFSDFCWEIVQGERYLVSGYNNNSPRRAGTYTDGHESAVVAMGTFEAFGSAATTLISTISIG
jgi:hypothetical protein